MCKIFFHIFVCWVVWGPRFSQLKKKKKDIYICFYAPVALDQDVPRVHLGVTVDESGYGIWGFCKRSLNFVVSL